MLIADRITLIDERCLIREFPPFRHTNDAEDEVDTSCIFVGERRDNRTRHYCFLLARDSARCPRLYPTARIPTTERPTSARRMDEGTCTTASFISFLLLFVCLQARCVAFRIWFLTIPDRAGVSSSHTRLSSYLVASGTWNGTVVDNLVVLRRGVFRESAEGVFVLLRKPLTACDTEVLTLSVICSDGDFDLIFVPCKDV